MPLYDQIELLCQAINAQGQGEAEEILARAREEAERRLQEAEGQLREEIARTRAAVEAQTRLEARNRIDRAELEGKRQVFQTKEALLNEVLGQVRARLLAWRETPDYQDWLRRTLPATLAQLEGEQFRVLAHPEEEKWLTPELLAEVGCARSCQLAFSAEPDLPPGGCVVVRADARVRFDQTFTGIIDRQRETLRAEAARKLWGS